MSFGSSAQICTRPARTAGSSPRIVDQMIDPLPAPVAPATRT
ncbi:hypothetical protein SAMN05216275_1699 [Streptosporangium canum]|uniref:Uncharacterized protein n=1 Tax=Streptosporangium canum TaxID=324952 RepID=A0A1I4FQK1_9ACTN|nr:hypothetical protein SAMN05216275_1699 [Streptosporangium canum]